MSTKIKSGNIGNNVIASGHMHTDSLTGHPEITTLDYANDYALVYDASDNSIKKIKTGNFAPPLDLSSVGQHIVPSAHEVYDLGSSTNSFRDLYLSGNTIHLGDSKLSQNADGDIEVKDENDELKKVVVKELQIGAGEDKVVYRKVGGVLKAVDKNDAVIKTDLSSNTTDDLAQGVDNLYYADSKAISAVHGHSSWKNNEWDTAYSWGNHADAGYLTSETDSQTLSWNGSNGQLTISNGNTVDLDGRYLQSFTETDTLQSVTSRGATTTNDISISNTQPKLRFKESDTSNVDKELLVSGGNFYIRRVFDNNTASSNLFVVEDDGDVTVTKNLSVSGTISGSLNYNDITNPPTIDNSVDYINAASFNTSNGVLTLSGVGRAGATVDLDGRYQASGNYDNYTSWTASDGTNTAAVTSGESVTINGSGATTVSLDASTQTYTISSTDTDTNTWRPIHDTPANGATTTSISSNWAFDNVKTAVPAGAVFTDTETTTNFTKVGNELRYVNEEGTTQTIDLSLYLDDTNLAKIISGTMNSSGIATFSRDDNSTFTVDMSVLLDDTNLARIVSAAWNTGNGVLTLTRNDGSTIPVDLDNRYLQIEIDTLASVTARGNSTSSKLILTNTHTIGSSVSGMANSSLLIGTTSSGIGIDNNEIMSSGGHFYLGTASGNNNELRFRQNGGDKLAVTTVGASVYGDLSVSGSISGNINYSQITNPPVIDNSVDYINGASFNTSNGVLTLSGVGRAGATVDLDGRYFNQTDSDARYVRQLGIVSSPDYQVASSRRVDPNTSNPTSEHYAISTFGNEGNVTGQLATHFVSGQAYTRGYNSSWSTWRKIWDSQNFNPATYDNGRFVKKTGDTMTGVLTFNRSATRQIINLNTTAGAHSLGWEPYHNTYGPDTWNSGFIAHKFYSNANTLTATIGTGGASGSTVSTFYGRTDFPAGLTSQTLDIGYTGDRTIQALSTDKSFGTYGDLHLQHYGGDLHAVHGGGVIYDNGSRVFSDRYHPNADKWTTARTNTVTLTGDATGSGSASVDGSGNWTVSVPVTVGNNSHNHTTLTGVTSIGFNAQSSDSASISTTINGSGTYFDFNLTDDNNNDWWRWRFTPSGSTVYDAMVLKPISNGNANLIVSGSITADSFSGSINYNQITNPPADVDNYADSVSFNTSNGILTIGRTGSLADLTVDLDGRYITSETDSQTLSWNGSTGQLSISNGNTVDLDNRYFTESESDSRYVNITGDTMSGQLTVNSNVVVTGDLKLNGSDSYIWTPNTAAGYTGFWDQYNARLALHYTNNHSGWGIMGQSESGTALKVYGNTKVTGGLEIAGSLSRGTYPSLSQYHTGADNIVLKGNASGISSIFFESEKDGTNINHPSDFGFIQYHAYGTSTAGESNELIIGVSNDADDHVIVNAPNVNGFKFRTGASATDYTVWHSGNLNPSSYLTSYSETDTLQSVCSRGSNTSTNITSTGSRMTINSTGSCYFTADGGVNQWKYLSLQTNGSTKWDIASKDNDASGALQFRPNGAPANRMLLDTSGNLTVQGLLTATQKSFTIDHPTKEGHKLRYGSLEGPENGVYVRGRLKDDNTIELPEYWSELVHEDSITVDVTSIGKQHTWVEDFSPSSVTIGTDGETVNCFYVVYGERKDVDKLVTEFKEVE